MCVSFNDLTLRSEKFKWTNSDCFIAVVNLGSHIFVELKLSNLNHFAFLSVFDFEEKLRPLLCVSLLFLLFVIFIWLSFRDLSANFKHAFSIWQVWGLVYLQPFWYLGRVKLIRPFDFRRRMWLEACTPQTQRRETASRCCPQSIGGILVTGGDPYLSVLSSRFIRFIDLTYESNYGIEQQFCQHEDRYVERMQWILFVTYIYIYFYSKPKLDECVA